MTTQQKPRRGSKKRPNVWVVPRRQKWAVHFEGQKCPVVEGLAQDAAERIARTIAREFGTELLIDNRQGQIRRRDSHGNDPFPPKG